MKNFFKKILIILPIFAFFFMIIFSFLGSSVTYDPKNENNNLTTELKTLNNNISKKSLVSVENNDYYAYLYLDFYRDAYVKTDIYYSYSIDETNGDLLAIITTIENEFTDIGNNYTYTNSYTFSVIPKINNNTDFLNVSNIHRVWFDFGLIRYQTTNYILPQIYYNIAYSINDIYNELIIEGNAGFDDAIIISNNYQWNDTCKKDFSIVDDSFTLLNELGDTYYDIGYSNGYDAGRDFGFDEGREYQQDLYEKSDNLFDNIWEFLEKGTSAVLAVFSIEILPGIPLSICIIVPLVFGIIFFIWKGGAQ